MNFDMKATASMVEGGKSLTPGIHKAKFEGIDVDVFENTGSEIHTTGSLKIKANQVAQTVLAHEYLANESYGSSQRKRL